MKICVSTSCQIGEQSHPTNKQRDCLDLDVLLSRLRLSVFAEALSRKLDDRFLIVVHLLEQIFKRRPIIDRPWKQQ